MHHNSNQLKSNIVSLFHLGLVDKVTLGPILAHAVVAPSVKDVQEREVIAFEIIELHLSSVGFKSLRFWTEEKISKFELDKIGEKCNAFKKQTFQLKAWQR